MQTHDEGLTEQDLAWLRRHTNFHGAETVLGAVFFMLFMAITVLFAGIWLGGPRPRRATVKYGARGPAGWAAGQAPRGPGGAARSCVHWRHAAH
ncbi:hypothetical protein [Achromobacter ruhlandii]|uniref:hypothetical protein n=1 Tax=Achromobacter ruhlandii TaxID=72557 RepID=UPI003B9BFA61